MPKEQLNNQIVIMIAMMSVFGSIASALSDDKLSFTKTGVLHLTIQIIVGGISGIIFGLSACWVVGENIYAVGAIAGIGSVFGINGLKYLTVLLRRFFEYKLKIK